MKSDPFAWSSSSSPQPLLQPVHLRRPIRMHLSSGPTIISWKVQRTALVDICIPKTTILPITSLWRTFSSSKIARLDVLRGWKWQIE